MEKRHQSNAMKAGGRPGDRAPKVKLGEKSEKGGKVKGEPPVEVDTAEHLARDLARVRANFGIDPLLGARSLAAAWTSPTDVTEEDEAEFVDAVADCLGAGLSLDAALDCWDTGGLAADAADDSGASDEEPTMVLPIASVRHAPGRRLLVR